MTINNISSYLVSTLGNPGSKVPLAVKDIINSVGMTYYSYEAGGKNEGKDRFVDEFGTQAIWLWGIPFFRKIIDKTVYKKMGYNPDIDIRVVSAKDKNLVNLAIERTKDLNLKKDMQKAVENLPTFKKLFYAKFIASTALTLGSYFALTKFRHKNTEESVKKDFYARKAKEDLQFKSKQQINNSNQKNVKNNFNGKKNISFGSGFGTFMQNFMFNPVQNMTIIDGGITAERLSNSRNKHEFCEYALKEGSFLFVMYCAGSLLQKGIEKLSEKIFKKPIDMDAKFLASEDLSNALKSNDINKQIEQFTKNSDDISLLKFISDNPKNIVVKALKKSNIVETMKNSDDVDFSKYIDTKAARNAADSLTNLVSKFKASNLNADKYLSKTKGLKVASVVANLGICCLAMGIVLPKTIMKFREQHSGTKEFHVAKQIEQKLAMSFQGEDKKN